MWCLTWTVQGGSPGAPDNKVHGANVGPTWVLSAPDGPHVGPMNLAIRDYMCSTSPETFRAICRAWLWWGNDPFYPYPEGLLHRRVRPPSHCSSHGEVSLKIIGKYITFRQDSEIVRAIQNTTKLSKYWHKKCLHRMITVIVWVQWRLISRQFDCLFKSLFKLITKETTQSHITDPLIWESADDRWIPLKGPIIRKAFPWYDLIESTKTTSMVDVSTGVLEKIKNVEK